LNNFGPQAAAQDLRRLYCAEDRAAVDPGNLGSGEQGGQFARLAFSCMVDGYRLIAHDPP
jgi:hypothetical protein